MIFYSKYVYENEQNTILDLLDKFKLVISYVVV